MINVDCLVVIRGAGDIATGIGYRLYKSGFKIVMLETDKPSVVRRKVAFAETVYAKKFKVEELESKLIYDINEVDECLNKGVIPVFIDPEGRKINEFKPDVVVDAILEKKNLGTNKDMADIVIGVGPGFEAGKDVDAVVETKRGHNLGKVILKGKPELNTGIPGNIEGYTEQRVLRENSNGKITVLKDIGSIVKKNDVVAKIDGVVRGIIRDSYDVTVGMQCGGKARSTNPRIFRKAF